MTPHRELRDGDGGWVTLWVLGLSVLVLAIGGIAVDVFRALDDRRDLAAIADAAAIAGASGVDVAIVRDEGVEELDVRAARARVVATIARQSGGGAVLGTAQVDVTPDLVTVELTREVELTLLRLLTPGEPPIRVTVTATAEPGVREAEG